jgi:hypothetical protein
MAQIRMGKLIYDRPEASVETAFRECVGDLSEVQFSGLSDDCRFVVSSNEEGSWIYSMCRQAAS